VKRVESPTEAWKKFSYGNLDFRPDAEELKEDSHDHSGQNTTGRRGENAAQVLCSNEQNTTGVPKEVCAELQSNHPGKTHRLT